MSLIIAEQLKAGIILGDNENGEYVLRKIIENTRKTG